MILSRLVRLSLLVLALMFTASVACRRPIVTQPDFTLLLSDSGHFRFEPVATPDGKLVYYLDDSTWPEPAWFGNPLRGGIHVFSLEDSSNRLLLPGHFYDLALSPDGMRLAVAVDSPFYQGTASRLLVLDTGAAHVDTLDVKHLVTFWQVWDLHFFQSGTALLYCIRADTNSSDFLFYSVLLESVSKETLLFRFSGYIRGFDVLDGDSVYVDTSMREDPVVNPAFPRWVAYTADHRALMLKDRWTGAVRRMSGSPSGTHFVEYPTWTRDGRGLLLSASRRNGDRTELWLLKNAGDYLTSEE